MGRSQVLVGRQKQLDRAKQRGRLDRGSCVSNERSDQALEAMLKDRFAFEPTIREIERIDLRQFLQETSGFDVSSAERLRQLAIVLEDAALNSQPSGWLALARIYERAETLADNIDDLANVQRSIAIAAHYLAESVDDDEIKTARRLWNAAYAAIHRSIETDSSWAAAHAVLAQMRYRDPVGDLGEGLADCERALEQDPNNGWSQFHRAFILRDLERYKEAAEAFRKVNFGFFTGERSDRLERLLSARAFCWLRCGHRGRAVRAFQALLSRYEKDPNLARNAYWWDLVDVATGELKDELGVRTKALVQRYADYMNDDFVNTDDCPQFIELVQSTLRGLVVGQSPERVGLIKIDHWFSQRWRGFVGKYLGLVGIHRTSSLRVPPFHPNRVVSELHYERDREQSYELLRNPPRIHTDQGSAYENLPPLASHRSPSVWMWYSGRSSEEDRASILVYQLHREFEEAWYVEVVKTQGGGWQTSTLAGVGRQHIKALLDDGATTNQDYPWEW